MTNGLGEVITNLSRKVYDLGERVKALEERANTPSPPPPEPVPPPEPEPPLPEPEPEHEPEPEPEHKREPRHPADHHPRAVHRTPFKPRRR